MTRSYSANGVTISSTNSGSGANICSKADITLPSDFEAEWTFMGGTIYSGEVAFGGMRHTHDHAQARRRTWYYYEECINQESATLITASESINNGDVFKVTRENHVLKIYRNDVLKHTITKSSDYPYLELGAFHSTRDTTIKDIKVKPL